MKYGTKIADVTICDVELPLYSNGTCTYLSNEHCHDNNGNYLGIKYQCVEFVRRYIYQKAGINLASLWAKGDAHDWYDARDKMNLSKIPIKYAQEGDIITFTGGPYGHIGIVNNISDHYINVTSQNLYNDERDPDVQISRNNLGRVDN